MIISRTPFRVSLFGGGTDYKEFFSQEEALLIGFTIDKYSYISSRLTPSILPYHSRFSYSKNEIIEKPGSTFEEYLSQINHNGIRGVLELLGIHAGIEISHFCDIPSQTGLGSSSSFVVGLINSIHKIFNWPLSKKSLAYDAISVERVFLNEPGGIQDQIWAAYGGINSIHISTDGSFKVKSLPISEEFVNEICSRCCLIFTGNSRNSFELANHHPSSYSAKKNIKDIALEAYNSFVAEDLNSVGKLLEDSWNSKKSLNKNISNPEIDVLYTYLKSCGMIGGKLLGAGGSGFIFGVFDKVLNKNMFTNQYPINIDYDGSKIIYS